MKPTALDMLNHKTPFNFLHFSLMFALSLAYFPVLAQDMAILADKQAAGHLQPIILQTANGLPKSISKPQVPRAYLVINIPNLMWQKKGLF